MVGTKDISDLKYLDEFVITVFFEPEKVKYARDVIDALEIPAEEVAICLINGFHSKLDDTVKDEDVLAIFPPVGGG